VDQVKAGQVKGAVEKLKTDRVVILSEALYHLVRGEAKNLHIHRLDSSVAESIHMDSLRMTGWTFPTRLKARHSSVTFLYSLNFYYDVYETS
jgi:hypothetical protein